MYVPLKSPRQQPWHGRPSLRKIALQAPQHRPSCRCGKSPCKHRSTDRHVVAESRPASTAARTVMSLRKIALQAPQHRPLCRCGKSPCKHRSTDRRVVAENRAASTAAQTVVSLRKIALQAPQHGPSCRCGKSPCKHRSTDRRVVAENRPASTAARTVMSLRKIALQAPQHRPLCRCGKSPCKHRSTDRHVVAENRPASTAARTVMSLRKIALQAPQHRPSCRCGKSPCKHRSTDRHVVAENRPASTAAQTVVSLRKIALQAPQHGPSCRCGKSPCKHRSTDRRVVAENRPASTAARTVMSLRKIALQAPQHRPLCRCGKSPCKHRSTDRRVVAENRAASTAAETVVSLRKIALQAPQHGPSCRCGKSHCKHRSTDRRVVAENRTASTAASGTDCGRGIPEYPAVWAFTNFRRSRHRMIIVSFIVVIHSIIIRASLIPGLYCGDRTCYEVLNIDRSTFNKNTLGKTYRRLAAQYHPDKVTDVTKKKEAEEKFRQIATAYETLKDDETRSDYDYYLDHPEQRAYNYYQYYRRRVAPKVDPKIVIFVTVLLISTFQFLSATHKYKEALDYALKQEKYRNAAKEIAKQRGLSLECGFRDKKSRKEYAEQIIRKIIEENVDIRGGYRKPSIYNTLLWTLIAMPYTIYKWIVWKFSWFIKYNIRKEEYDDEAKSYLIRRNMGLSEEQFGSFDDNERAMLFENELWDSEKYDEWKAAKEEEQKERLATSGRYKRYRRYMRNQTGSTINFTE